MRKHWCKPCRRGLISSQPGTLGHGRDLDESAEQRANIATRAGGGKFTSSAQLAGDGTSTPGALVATHCVAVKAKLEWQSPRQLSRLRCAFCSDPAFRLLLCCFWFSWSAVKTYPLAPGCPSTCRRSSSGRGTATTI